MQPFVSKISNEETAELPAIEFTGPIRVVEREDQIAEACAVLARQPILGFDTETRPSFRPGVTYRVALLQLSGPGVSYLFRLNRIPLAAPIIRLLEDPNLPKVGLAIANDLHVLHQLRHFREANFIELQKFVPQWGIEEQSLRKLAAIVLGKRVSKAQRLSNWEAKSLTDKQQIYAATDAWACIRIYQTLMAHPTDKAHPVAESVAEPIVELIPVPTLTPESEKQAESVAAPAARHRSRRRPHRGGKHRHSNGSSASADHSDVKPKPRSIG